MALWSNRFCKPPHPEALKFSSSIEFDKRLYHEDIEGSLAHVAMLAKQSIITRGDCRKITAALRAIRREIDSGKFLSDAALKRNKKNRPEDIHMAIERRLIERVGPVGGLLHTARSRNDQVALDERLFLRGAITTIRQNIRQLQKSLLSTAESYHDLLMPGYTHQQRAQPILLAHHLLAYVSMLHRDGDRFEDCLRRVERSPLGAAALAGTSFPIDRKFVATLLDFPSIEMNSIDAVSDRDVQIEFLSACSITMMHLSRFAGEIILWSSTEWNFLELGDEFTTGSSIMPQKKNPDIAELVRGKTGRVYGDLLALLTIMKGLPLAYNRDMQEDKEPLFDAADTVGRSLRLSALMVKSCKFNRDRFTKELDADFSLATELADYLTGKAMPFRTAHAIVAKIVRDCLARNIQLNELTLKEFNSYSKLFRKDVFKSLSARHSIEQKRSVGSTSPNEVRKSIRYWKKVFAGKR